MKTKALSDYQKFKEFLADECYDLKMYKSGKYDRKIWWHFKSLLNKQRVKDVPLGVSQWKKHGKKYHYWEFFVEEMVEEVEKQIDKLPQDSYGATIIIDEEEFLSTLKSYKLKK